MAPGQHALGSFPSHARVGDGNAVSQFCCGFRKRLVALLKIAFDHQTDQRGPSSGALSDDIAPHFFLTRMLFTRIGMTAIDHHYRRHPRLRQPLLSLADTGWVIIGPAMAAAEHQVSGGIPSRSNDAGNSLLIDPQE